MKKTLLWFAAMALAASFALPTTLFATDGNPEGPFKLTAELHRGI